MRIPFGSQSYQHASLPISAQRMVNCYLEPAPPQAQTLAAVVAAYGVKSWGSAGTKLRGAKVIRSRLYVVSGSNLYRVASNGVATLLGAIPGTGFVFIEGDETNVMVVEPQSRSGWFWNGTVVAQITDDDWPGAVWLGYIDGYFVIIAPDSGQFYITANRNPASIDAFEFASAEQYPDNLVTGIVDHGELILFGTESGEGFYNSGNADFPLSKIQSASFEVGCIAPRAVAKADNGIVFPGHDGKVYRLNGYTPVAISTPVVEQAIQKATDRDFVGLVWQEAGHSFYAIKCADFAFVYDFSTQLWHERESYGMAWRWEFVVRTAERWVVGDSQSNALGELSHETFTEFGQTLRASATSPPVSDDKKRITHSRVELVFENGVGLVTGQGSDPMVGLQFSDNDGRTWSSEKWRRIGKIGEFGRRTRWHRLGKSRSRIYRYFISDPVRRTLILATTKARVCAN